MGLVCKTSYYAGHGTGINIFMGVYVVERIVSSLLEDERERIGLDHGLELS